MTGEGPRRRRARIWADLYVAFFGADEDTGSEEDDTDCETATEAARER
jgi:hypothetical protein